MVDFGKHTLTSTAALSLAFAVGCGEPAAEAPLKTSLQEVRAGASDDGGVLLSMDVLVTDAQGHGVPCGEGEVSMDVEISRNGTEGPWVLVESTELASTCVPAANGDVSLVIDNSGSLEKDLDVLRAGAERVVDRIVGDGGRVSLVRVSTDATVASPLTGDRAVLQQGIDDLFISNGWTALWDGVRMANETLGAGVSQGVNLETYAGASAFCASERNQGIIVFTDGAENNSRHQNLWSDKYPGDGIDTTFGDIASLKVRGAMTPIYAVGVGDDIDRGALTSMGAASGGRFVELDDMQRVDDVLGMVAEYFGAAHRTCTDVPSHLCGSLDVRVTHRYRARGQEHSEVSHHHLDVPCPARATGRVATILLTMNASETSEETLMSIVANTVNWVSPVDAPKVLFVLDDGHHGEFDGDTRQIHEKLVEAGYAADYLEEPKQGLRAKDLEGYDVVWFSNPGHPMDDERSFNSLLEYSQAGGGVVFQGDDMSYSFGKAFPTTPLTRLENADNGTSYCDTNVDNGKGGRYRVSMAAESHPIVAGIEGQSFLYGDDIDTATPVAEGTEVVAWATIDGKDGCAQKPVITAFTPKRD
jgi:hypothetical protein